LIFYLLDQNPARYWNGAKPKPVPLLAPLDCVKLHLSKSSGLPQWDTSVLTAPSGVLLDRLGARNDGRTMLSQLWAGWFFTGTTDALTR